MLQVWANRPDMSRMRQLWGRVTYPLVVAWLGAGVALGGTIGALATHPLRVAVLLSGAVVVAGICVQIPYGWGDRSVATDLVSMSSLIVMATLPRSFLLVGLTYLAMSVSYTLRKRRLLVTAFNAGNAALCSFVSLALADLVWTLHLDGRLPLLLGVAALSDLLSSVLTAGAIASTTQARWLDQVVSGVSRIPHTLVVLALGASVVITVDHPLLWPVPVFGGAVLIAGLWWFAHRVTQTDALESLITAASPIQAHDPVRAMEEIGERAMKLFACERVELSVTSPAGPGWWSCTVTGGAPLDLRATAREPLTPVGANLVSAELRGPRHEEKEALLGHVTLALGSHLRLTRNEANLLRLFAQATSAAWARVLDHQDLVAGERERIAETQRRLHAQTHEPLTGLPNRAQLDSLVEVGLSQGRDVVLMLVRLARFREVNEILGHHSGDALLREVAHRLRTSVRAGDMVSRVDGAQFAIALFDVAAEHVLGVAGKVHSRLREAMTIDGLSVPVEVAIGMAHGPGDASSAVGLLRCAEVATAAAARAGVPTLYYDPSQQQGSAEDLRLLTELAEAVARDELILHYQPKIDLRSGAVVGMESLVRWAHPTHGLLPPSAFISHLEHSALIVPVTLHLVEKALIDSRGWPERDEPYTVAVNLGARCLLDPGLPDSLRHLCQRNSVDPSLLVLEITETMAVSPLPVAQEVLSGLRDAGFSMSVDDFGTGYSSLTFLHYNRVSELKIDRSFVGSVTTDASARAIIGAAVAMAHDLGMTAVAEGVETSEQLAAMITLGVDQAQGYLMGRPMPAHALEGHLASTPVDPHVAALRKIPLSLAS
jgi:diguanylate cyclase (GGDEF)-like protein